MTRTDILIVGAGATGLTTARALVDAGKDLIVLEKSRWLGGRIATRRRDGLQFDHGAPQAHVSNALWNTLGAAALPTWSPNKHARIGKPGMSDIVRPLAEGLDIHFQVEVKALARRGHTWTAETSEGAYEADQVILTIPAPQVLNVAVAVEPQLVQDLAKVTFAPCYALMVAFETAPGWPEFDPAPGGPFGLILRDSAKPDRPAGPDCWVCHANAEWSHAHLEMERPEAAALLLSELARLKGDLPKVTAQMGHRWRYAQTVTPLGQDHWANADGTLRVGGDWTLGPCVDDAVRSGAAMAAGVLAGS